MSNFSAWKNRVFTATKGSKFGAILRCAMGIDNDNYPKFSGKCSVTSDGFVMCNFLDRNGIFHLGAFIGAWQDIENNINGLSIHLKLKEKEKKELFDSVNIWIGSDYRTKKYV